MNQFSEIPTYDDYIEADEIKSKEMIQQTLGFLETKREELSRFCKKNTYDEIEKLEFIYYALSEKYSEWESFLTSEYQRVFDLAKQDGSFKELLPLLENILPDEGNSKSKENLIQYFSSQLNSPNAEVKFYALDNLYMWTEEDLNERNPEIINRVRQCVKDENRKIRWMANKILKECGLEVKINWADKIRAKFQSPFQF